MSDDSDGFEWVGTDEESSEAEGEADASAEQPAEGDGTEAEQLAAADDPEDAEDEEYEPSVAGVFGARSEDAPQRTEIVPESPELENVLFVLLGVVLGLFVIYRAVVVFGA